MDGWMHEVRPVEERGRAAGGDMQIYIYTLLLYISDVFQHLALLRTPHLPLLSLSLSNSLYFKCCLHSSMIHPRLSLAPSHHPIINSRTPLHACLLHRSTIAPPASTF